MTQESIRKHVSQMSLEEVNYCLNLVQGTEWITTDHVEERLKEKGGDLGLLFETIGYGDLVEFHRRNGSNRLLFRGTRAVHNYVPCVVVAPGNSRVITVFWNHVLDNHRTIDMSRYNEELDIISLFKKGK